MKKSGFTLIELLIVIGVFSLISSILLSILFISLRGSKKSDLLLDLKQNGSTAMTQMVRSIRYAKSLDDPATCYPAITTSSLTITSFLDNAQTTYSCPSSQSPTITSNSASLIDSTSTSVINCSFICRQENAGDAPTITIKYIIKSNNPASFFETTGSIPFQTSVTMRNYKP